MFDRRLRAIFAALLLVPASCRDSTGTDETPVVGRFCQTTTPTVVRTAARATVTLFVNRSQLEDVRGSDGRFVLTEFRSCIMHECVYEDAAGLTDQQLIDRCRDSNSDQGA